MHGCAAQVSTQWLPGPQSIAAQPAPLSGTQVTVQVVIGPLGSLGSDGAHWNSQCEPGAQVVGVHSSGALGTQNGSQVDISQPVPSGSGSHGKQRSSQCASGPQSKSVQVVGGSSWHSK